MTAYYNEIGEYAAQWLRNRIDRAGNSIETLTVELFTVRRSCVFPRYRSKSHLDNGKPIAQAHEHVCPKLRYFFVKRKPWIVLLAAKNVGLNELPDYFRLGLCISKLVGVAAVQCSKAKKFFRRSVLILGLQKHCSFSSRRLTTAGDFIFEAHVCSCLGKVATKKAEARCQCRCDDLSPFDAVPATTPSLRGCEPQRSCQGSDRSDSRYPFRRLGQGPDRQFKNYVHCSEHPEHHHHQHHQRSKYMYGLHTPSENMGAILA